MDRGGPFVLGGQRLGRLYPDVGVPLARRQDDDLIQELVNTGQQVLPVLCFVGDVMENLPTNKQNQAIANKTDK